MDDILTKLEIFYNNVYNDISINDKIKLEKIIEELKNTCEKCECYKFSENYSEHINRFCQYC